MKVFYVLYLIGAGVLAFVICTKHKWPLWASLACAIGTPLATHALVLRSDRKARRARAKYGRSGQ